MLSNDAALMEFKKFMKRMEFIIEHQAEYVVDDEIPQWINDWVNEINDELVTLEKEYPNLIDIL